MRQLLSIGKIDKNNNNKNPKIVQFFFKIILAILSDLWYYNTCKEEKDKKANKKTYKKLKKFLTNLFTDDIIKT